MTHEQILSELEQLASNCGISIRYEKGDFDGGYCVLKAERLIVINKRLVLARRTFCVGQGLAEVALMKCT